MRNPFVDGSITGEFEQNGSSNRITVDGFCDSPDGSIYRVRFMPSKAGSYTCHVKVTVGQQTESYSGTFTAIDQQLRGPLRVDPAYPWHFVWEGTGLHYFFNGTTAYWLMGWRDERTIQYSIDRLSRLKVNRMRVSLSGRTSTAYGEAVMNGPRWNVNISPWPAQDVTDFTHPGFDYSRFDLAYWQKFDRMLRYAGARLGGFFNITWDLGDDLEGFRDEKWTHETGMSLQQWDPYHHLATSHPMKTIFQDRASSWFGFTSYQEWSRNQHSLMLESRRLQQKTGRIIPQSNEEYGYEDHYPDWAAPGSDSAEVLRRTAWEIYMAGGYQTAGESARRGTNIRPDTGGGWMNGRGDDTQIMFVGYGHIVEFFTGFEWWKSNPHDDLVNDGNYCLADPGNVYAIYLPHGGKATLQLGPGRFNAEWFNATSGQRYPVTDDVTGPYWTSSNPPDEAGSPDWAI